MPYFFHEFLYHVFFTTKVTGHITTTNKFSYDMHHVEYLVSLFFLGFFSCTGAVHASWVTMYEGRERVASGAKPNIGFGFCHVGGCRSRPQAGRKVTKEGVQLLDKNPSTSSSWTGARKGRDLH